MAHTDQIEDKSSSRSSESQTEDSAGSSSAASEQFLSELRNSTNSSTQQNSSDIIMAPREPRDTREFPSPTTGMLKEYPSLREITGGLPKGLEGKYETNTGDKLEYKDGKQTLITNAGNTLEVDRNGNVTGDGINSIKASKDGKERIVTMDDGTTVVLDNRGIARVEHALPQDKAGSYTLTTGDRIESDGKSQTLTTPDGSKVKVNPDGSYEVNGKLVSASGDGKSIKLADGTTIQLDNGKIAGVERNGQKANVAGEIPRGDWDTRLIIKLPPVDRPYPNPLPNPFPRPFPRPDVIDLAPADLQKVLEVPPLSQIKK